MHARLKRRRLSPLESGLCVNGAITAFSIEGCSYKGRVKSVNGCHRKESRREKRHWWISSVDDPFYFQTESTD